MNRTNSANNRLNDDSIVIEYGRVPRDKMALFQFICEGHEGLLVVSALPTEPPSLRLMIARDLLEEWNLLKQELIEKVGFEPLDSAPSNSIET